MSKQATKQAYEALNSTSQQIAQNIESTMVPIEQISALLYTNSALNSFLTGNYSTDYSYVEAYQSIESLIDNFLIANSDIYNISFYVNNESIRTDGLFFFPMDKFNIEEWNAHASGKRGISFFTETSKIGQYYLHFARVLDYGDHNSPYGYLVISIREEALSQLYSLSDKDRHVYIIDESGKILSDTEKQYTLQQMSQIIPDYVSLNEKLDFCSINGKRHLFVSCGLSHGWRVIVTAPSQSVYGDINRSLSQMVIISVLCILLALVLTFYITQYFSSRLSLLTQQIELIESRNFGFYIKTEGNDELGKLEMALNKMGHALDNAINEVYKKEVERKEADLRLLQSQINPHFLFNALSTISTIAMYGNATDTATFTSHLSQFYKLSLNNGKKEISIREEISINRHYISIQQTRFRDMFFFDWTVDENILDYLIPKLVIQPFVENIFNHAVRDDASPVHTSIWVGEENDHILIKISDDGAGIAEETLKNIASAESSQGYGLKNVDARLKLYFGNEYGIRFESTLNFGTTAFIYIPKKLPDAGGLSCLFK